MHAACYRKLDLSLDHKMEDALEKANMSFGDMIRDDL